MIGEFKNGFCILKQSGIGFFECSDGKKVLLVAVADVEKGDFKGELMYNIQPKMPPMKLAKAPVKKKVTKKKSTKKVK